MRASAKEGGILLQVGEQCVVDFGLEEVNRFGRFFRVIAYDFCFEVKLDFNTNMRNKVKRITMPMTNLKLIEYLFFCLIFREFLSLLRQRGTCNKDCFSLGLYGRAEGHIYVFTELLIILEIYKELWLCKSLGMK